jgi:competence protein ComEA
VRLTSRRSDDADVIRARLRALLAPEAIGGGWVPEDDGAADDDPGPALGRPFPAGDALPDPGTPDSGPGLPDGIGRHRAPGAAVRWDPGRRAVWALCATAVAAALILLAWTWFDRPQVTPAPARPAGTTSGASASAARTPAVGESAATSATVVVSVVGLVARPGLQTLPTGSRVADAVAAAGGLLPQADPATINLAAPVADGQQIAVGVPAAAGAAGAPGGASAPAGSSAGPVDLNSATVTDLDALPGIGAVLAQRIVDYRTQHGRFATVDQLDDVPGIGPALYGRLSPQVRV